MSDAKTISFLVVGSDYNSYITVFVPLNLFAPVSTLLQYYGRADV